MKEGEVQFQGLLEPAYHLIIIGGVSAAFGSESYNHIILRRGALKDSTLEGAISCYHSSLVPMRINIYLFLGHIKDGHGIHSSNG